MKNILAVLIVACFVVGCGPGPVETGGQTERNSEPVDKYITIGSIYPLTGNGATYGIPIQKSTKLAVEEINAFGGVDGKILRIVYEDGKCNPKDAATAISKLINQDNVQIILGGICSGETLGAAPIAEEKGVVLLTPGSTSPEISHAGDYVFRNIPHDGISGVKISEHLAEKGELKAAIISENTDYPQGVMDVFRSEFPARGGEIVIDEKFPPDETDFRTTLLKVKESGATSLYVITQTPPTLGLLVQQFRELDLPQQFFSNVFVSGTDFLAEYGDLVEGAIYSVPEFDVERAETKVMLDKYRVAYEEEPGTSIPPIWYTAAYDAVYVVKEGIEAVGNDGEALKDYLAVLQGRVGATGVLNMDENGDPESEYILMTIKGGVPVPLETAP